MADSFILGLSSGSACLVTCGMVLFPYMIAGPPGLKRIATDLSIFMLTRLLVYFLLATLIWYSGRALFSSAVIKTYVTGSLYIVFAVLLIWYSAGKNNKKECPAAIVRTVDSNRLVPVMLGLVNSLGFCPALLIVLTKGAAQTTLVQSYSAFLAFFLGSSLWFFPLPFAAKIQKRKVLETIAILATGLAGTIFIIKGLTMIIGGIVNG